MNIKHQQQPRQSPVPSPLIQENARQERLNPVRKEPSNQQQKRSLRFIPEPACESNQNLGVEEATSIQTDALLQRGKCQCGNHLVVSQENCDSSKTLNKTPGHICTQRSKVKWEQSSSQINIKIHCIASEQPKVVIENFGRRLKFEVKVSVQSGEQLFGFTYDLFAPVHEREYQCSRLEDHILLVLHKSNEHHYHWPQLFAVHEEDKKDQEFHSSINEQPCRSYDLMRSDESTTYQVQAAQNDRSCFEDIDLYLSQLNRILPGPVPKDNINCKELQEKDSKICKDNDFDTNLKAAFKKYYSKTGCADESNRDKKIILPKYDEDIFNPFKKASHNLSSKRRINSGTTTMKHDYRQDTSSGSSSAIDSSKNTAKYALDFKKTYLFLYNVLLFVMFLMVFMILAIKVVSKTLDDDTIRGSALIIKILTYIQLLESIHPILGLVPGGPMMPFLQVVGRIIVNLFLSDPTIRIDAAPYAHYLFIVWSCIEIFRYSFYALRVFKVEIYPITWCRYTLFMPLYPMGGFCESQVIMSTIKYYGKTGTYSVSLPNAANISFNLPIFLKFYTFVLLGPSIFYLMRYMWSQRCKQLKKEKMA